MIGLARPGQRARLEREAREAIALIERRKSEIAEAFYDIADALVRLQEPVKLRIEIPIGATQKLARVLTAAAGR